MDRDLKIFDVSYLVHMGSKSNYKSNTIMGLQCGGLIYLMEKVFTHLSRGSSVALAFDSAITSKKETFAEYKATRTRDMSIFVQNQMLLDFCTKMGIPVYKKDGMEADEMIFNIVRTNTVFYPTMDIYCHDADICCNILHDGIRCVGCGGDPLINTENYPYEIFKDTVIPYNSILPYIIIFGKKSNNIAPVRLECFTDNQTIFGDFIAYCRKNYEPSQWSDTQCALSWVLSKSSKLPKNDSKELMRRIKMIYPRKDDTDKYIVPLDCKANLKKDEVVRFLRMFGMKASAMNLGLVSEMNSLLDNSVEDKRIIIGYKNMVESGNLLASADFSIDDWDDEADRKSVFTVDEI